MLEADESTAGGRTLRPHPDVISRPVADELVLVHLQTNEMYSLNRTGARLWELVAGGLSPADSVVKMLDEFDVSRAQLEREVQNLLTLLLRERLLVEPNP